MEVRSGFASEMPPTAIANRRGVHINDLLTVSNQQKVKFIDERNQYRLMASSHLPSVERFKNWIFEELILRALKEDGYLLAGKGGGNRRETTLTRSAVDRIPDSGT